MDFLFYEKDFQRVVVEPDVNNEKIHVINKRAGFEYVDTIQLPTKTAHLALCTLRQYQTAQAHLATLQTVEL